jgi:hypothetical protein
MNVRDRPYFLFFCFAVGAYVVADIGFSVVASIWVAQDPIGEALKKAIYYAATQPIGSLMLLAPFALLGWMAASLAAKKTLGAGLLLFAAGVTALGLMYFWGHIGAEQAMQNRKWTSAALAVGLLPFQSVPILFVILIVRLLAGRKRHDEEI